MGLQEDREAKKQERLEKAQEKRKPKLTYVHGLDGRRYINDKILRNLEGSQGGASFSCYTSVANYEANGYLSYDDLMEETEKLTQEASQAHNSFDQFAPPSQQDGFAISHAAEVANADLEAAFQQAASLGKTVHATMNDMSLGAFQAQAFNNVPPATEVHGFTEAQAAPDAHAEKVTGDINTTVYDGYHDAAQKAPFAFQPVMSTEAFNAAYEQQAADLPFENQNIFQTPNVPHQPAFPDYSGQTEPVEQQEQNVDQSGYVAPGAVGKPKGIAAKPSKYGMLADDGEPEQPWQAPPQPPVTETSRTSQDARLAGMTVSQQMRALPPPVPYEQNATQTSAPAQGKAEYNKLLGGLFKDGGAEPPAQSVSDAAQAPSFNQAMKQAQPQSPPDQKDISHAPQSRQDAVNQSPWSGPPGVHVEPQPEPVPQAQMHEAEAQNAVQTQPPSSVHNQQEELQQPDVSAQQTSPSNDSLVDFSTTAEKEKPKFERKKPPLPKQRAGEVYFEDNATSGKTSVFKMPTEGVVRSSRGTVELLVHKGGRMFRPHYNPVGILLRVDVSDGFALIKGQADKAPWQMTDREGNPLDEDVINTVAFDKKGNLWYQTVTGKKTKFLVDGGVEVTSPDGEVTKM